MKSPTFSSFRSLMSNWDEVLAREDLNHQIQTLVDGPSFIIFFTRKGEVFGAPEESRVVFSRLKKPQKGDDWFDDEANFLALNLSGVIKGDGSQCVFGKRDIKSLKVIDKDEAMEMLLKQAKSDPEPNKTAQVIRIIAKGTTR